MRKVIIILIAIILTGCQTKTKVEGPKENREQIKINISEKTNTTLEFVNYIEKNYGENSIDKLNESLKKDTYEEKIWYEITKNSLKTLKYLQSDTKEANVKVINNNKQEATLSFIGDVSLADNFEIIPEYDKRGQRLEGILSTDIIEMMRKADVMVANSEFTISDRGTPIPNKIYTFRALPKRVSIYHDMGVDLLTLANNHVYDFGELAFGDMLETLEKNNLPYIGAGRNINEASKPYYFIVNGYKIGFVNATRAEKYILTPAATETTGGVLRAYDPTLFIETIKKTKEESDYVIALIHWGKEDSHELENVQKETGKLYIDAGADALIGTHAHVLQGVEFYNDKLIAYNLGDFIFNKESKPTGLLNITISENGTLDYHFIPCYQENEKTTLLENEEKTKLLNNMTKWSVNAIFEENGKITKK